MTLSRRTFLRSSAGLLAASLIIPAVAREASGQDLSFLAVGDWGKPNLADNARRIAKQMGIAANRLNAQFVISTGDNFYENGVRDTHDPQWARAFEDVYTAPSLQRPWYVVLGNHDYLGNPDAEIAYSLISDRWHMPSRYYTVQQTLGDGSHADFFYLDTNPMADLNLINRWSGTEAAVEAQLAWLDAVLGASTAPWKIVVGHHTVFSGGEHGQTPELVSRLKPLLEQHGVQVYINGHDHDLEHLMVDGIHYITTGGGSEINQTGYVDGTVFAKSSLGFLVATLRPETMEIAFIDDAGAILHQATIEV